MLRIARQSRVNLERDRQNHVGLEQAAANDHDVFRHEGVILDLERSLQDHVVHQQQ
ncbi:hypothetical protein CSUB01_12610 [Colletotrichum sublineola]|uniref:Uncharacterized protein n=1 Tax=Colletotrichum sublineola TaxID=1173701 RepID=A0A066XRV1_COLSU|nr:hypothetical protein CSUB01_12610 [Colletotrichum sublineola]